MFCIFNSGGQLKWSNCTEAKLKSVLERNYATCLFNQPTNRHNTNAACQNGFIDDEEECDCGTKEECERMGNHCCNYTTCKLHPGSECDVGPCCQNCKIKSEGSICRDKINDCDLPEYCDGKSQVCGPDTYVHNGRPCSFGQEKSLCYFGVCHTYDNQCKSHWGADAYYFEQCYHKLNVVGANFGCCKLLGPKNYMKCAKKDVLCGKLQCSMSKVVNGRTPLSGGHAHHVSFGSTTCWSVSLSPDDPDRGMVETGSMCGENKVCSNNTCLDVKDVYDQPECRNNCSGNGICNNLGHCHCNPGYGCPNCSEKCDSEGGSVDSGNNCYCPGPTTAPKTTEIGKTTRPQTTHETPKAPTEPIATTSRISEEPTEPIATTSRISEGGESTDEESTDLAKIIVPVVLGVLVLIIVLLCIVFRRQILERFRKFRLSGKPSLSNDYRVAYSSRENLAEPSTTSVSENNPGGKVLSFTSLSFMPESKIDSKHAPDNTDHQSSQPVGLAQL